jgi:hypothetical protein
MKLEGLINESISIELLIALCNEYDDSHGTYPEHPLEGQSVLVFILSKLAGLSEYDDEISEFYKKYVESGSSFYENEDGHMRRKV